MVQETTANIPFQFVCTILFWNPLLFQLMQFTSVGKKSKKKILTTLLLCWIRCFVRCSCVCHVYSSAIFIWDKSFASSKITSNGKYRLILFDHKRITSDCRVRPLIDRQNTICLCRTNSWLNKRAKFFWFWGNKYNIVTIHNMHTYRTQASIFTGYICSVCISNTLVSSNGICPDTWIFRTFRHTNSNTIVYINTKRIH